MKPIAIQPTQINALQVSEKHSKQINIQTINLMITCRSLKVDVHYQFIVSSQECTHTSEG